VAEIIVIPMTGLFVRVFGMRGYMMGTTFVPGVLHAVRLRLEPAKHDRLPHAAGLYRRRADSRWR
jgi:hypothetical protein